MNSTRLCHKYHVFTESDINVAVIVLQCFKNFEFCAKKAPQCLSGHSVNTLSQFVII